MICEQCKAEGKLSKVSSLGGRVTLLAFMPHYDEAGVYHSHDPNKYTTFYLCSNEHRWHVVSEMPCPAPGCKYAEER